MNIDEMKKVMKYNKYENPERTNVTFERIIEVFENVLLGKTKINIIKENNKDVKEWRTPLSDGKIDEISIQIDALGLPPERLKKIVEQISYSEISTDEAIDLHKKYKIPVSELETDIIPVKGQGCWIMDTKGNWYLDMDSNYSATNLGMSNDEIAKGLFNQAKTLISMKEDRVQIARTRFLKEIGPMMPKGLHYFYWQNSGGEAVDKALKIAKAFTNSKDVIAFKGGFHGRTHGAVTVTWEKNYKKPFNLDNEDWVHFAEFNNINSVKKIVEDTGAKIIILEMVQGEEAGNRPADADFIKELWKLAKEKEIVIIDDEVQAGFGRTAIKKGDWFACMSYDVVPDIMTIGKSFGGGYPVTAIVTSKKVSDAMKPSYDGSTFGGNPMAMTSALIATRQMKEKNITGNVIARSKELRNGLEELKNKYPVIEEISGRGLMIAFSVGNEQNVEKLVINLYNEGVKTSLSTGKYLRLLPPTIITKGEVDTFLKCLDNALHSLKDGGGK